MALVQDAPFRDYQEIKLDVLLVDQDGDSLSAKVKEAFRFTQCQPGDGSTIPLTAKQLVRSGKYKAAIIIPPHSSETLRRKTRQLITTVFSNFGLPADTSDSAALPVIELKILFDPAIKANYQQSLSGSIEKIIANVQTHWVLDELQNQLSEGNAEAKRTNFDLSQIVRVNQGYASEKYQGFMLNSVQHNVPAWTMFAMFFILYPLGGKSYQRTGRRKHAAPSTDLRIAVSGDYREVYVLFSGLPHTVSDDDRRRHFYNAAAGLEQT